MRYFKVVIEFLMLLAGAVVTLYPPDPLRTSEKRIWLTIFLVLGSVNVGLTIWTNWIEDKADQVVATAISGTNATVQEILEQLKLAEVRVAVSPTGPLAGAPNAAPDPIIELARTAIRRVANGLELAVALGNRAGPDVQADVAYTLLVRSNGVTEEIPRKAPTPFAFARARGVELVSTAPLTPEQITDIANGLITVGVRITATYPVERGRMRYVFEGDVNQQMNDFNIKANHREPVTP